MYAYGPMSSFAVPSSIMISVEHGFRNILKGEACTMLFYFISINFIFLNGKTEEKHCLLLSPVLTLLSKLNKSQK